MPESLWVSDILYFHNKDEFALMNILPSSVDMVQVLYETLSTS